MPTIKELLIIKLTSGEEIMGKIMPSGDDEVILNKNFQIFIIPHEDGRQEIGMMPYHIHTNLHERLPMKKQHILFDYKPSQQMVDLYNRFTSPIIQAGNSGLITA
jgi:hypothetical protein